MSNRIRQFQGMTIPSSPWPAWYSSLLHAVILSAPTELHQHCQVLFQMTSICSTFGYLRVYLCKSKVNWSRERASEITSPEHFIQPILGTVVESVVTLFKATHRQNLLLYIPGQTKIKRPKSIGCSTLDSLRTEQLISAPDTNTHGNYIFVIMKKEMTVGHLYRRLLGICIGLQVS